MMPTETLRRESVPEYFYARTLTLDGRALLTKKDTSATGSGTGLGSSCVPRSLGFVSTSLICDLS